MPSFSPHHVHTLKGRFKFAFNAGHQLVVDLVLSDVIEAARNQIPPIPSLYPIEPITRAQLNDAIEPVRSSSTVLSQKTFSFQVNYVHLLRGVTHGRLSLSLKQVEL